MVWDPAGGLGLLTVSVLRGIVVRSTPIDGARMWWLATLGEGFLLRASTVWCRVLPDAVRSSACGVSMQERGCLPYGRL